ncbi:kinesin-like protein KIF18A [Ischnura elegans]|uniref:kinesin-like protein KIF18A n=1 Tax=Ischnura elegans TaxID=197161 RepID=UPI001ED8B028|nr:kinesin-like protein KIF18A [Ischnura elegans]
MAMMKRDLSRAFSPGKNARRTIGRRRSIGKRTPVKPATDNIKVVIRVRPLNSDGDQNTRAVIKVVDDKMLMFDPKEEEEDFYFQGVRQKTRDLNKKSNKDMRFVFDRVFGPAASTEDVFAGSTKEVIGHLLEGYNCSVFVYGATGAGKTYTMLGTRDCPGITYLTMVELYQQMELLKGERKFEVAVSYMEVYNETVKDLINPSKDSLLVREDDSYGVKVQGLSVLRPSDAAHLLSLLESGNRNRTQHPTDANAESSRSHAICQVYVKMTIHNGSAGDNVEGSVVKVVKLSMIDLAGSERGSATGFKGSRFAEGANINKSLLALGNCINALADGLKHIPYRDSKLTRLLKDSLGGNCKTVMIANISPAPTSYEDTYNTLKYADRAKKIKLKTKKNVVAMDMHVMELACLVEELRQENASLKQKVSDLESGGGNCGMEKLRRENAELKQRIAELEAKVGGGGGVECSCSRSSAVEMENSAPGQGETDVEIRSNILNGTFDKDVDELNKEPSAIINGTFVSSSAVQEVHDNGFVIEPAKDDILEQILQACSEREALQKKLLQFEAEIKVLSWKAAVRRRALARAQLLSCDQNEEITKTEFKSRSAEEKINVRLNRIMERKKIVEDQLFENGRKLKELNKKASPPTLIQMELKSQHLVAKGWHCVADHAHRMACLAEKNRSQTELVLEKIASNFQMYYCILSAHNLLTQSHERHYEKLVKMLQGAKGVSWQDQVPSQKSDMDSTILAKVEKDDLSMSNDVLNETFSMYGGDGDREQNFAQLVYLPVEQILEVGMNEPEDGKDNITEGEIAAVSDGLNRVELFSSLEPTSILSSVLPFATNPSTSTVSSTSYQAPKVATAIPRTSCQPRAWTRPNGSIYGVAQRGFSQEVLRENQENTTSLDKRVQGTLQKGSLSTISPQLTNGSARKNFHSKLKHSFTKPHPYLSSYRSRLPLEPKHPTNSNYLTLSSSKNPPSSSRKTFLTTGGSMAAKLASLGK